MLLLDMRVSIIAVLAAGTIGWAFGADVAQTNTPAAGDEAKTNTPAVVEVAITNAPGKADAAGTNKPVAGAAAVAAPGAKATPAAANALKQKAMTPEEQAYYSRLTRGELELTTQHKLLTELAEEHLRVADTTRVALPEQSRWEILLANELRNRSSLVLTQLNDVTKQRLAFETAHVAMPLGAAGVGASAPLDSRARSIAPADSNRSAGTLASAFATASRRGSTFAASGELLRKPSRNASIIWSGMSWAASW